MRTRVIATLLILTLALPSAAQQQTQPAATPANPFFLPGTNIPNLIAYLGLFSWINTIKAPPQKKHYEMAPVIDRRQKTTLMQAMMPFLGNLGIRDVMNLMAIKYKAKEGLSFDDVVESMKLRANQLNFKLVGHSPMWKDFVAVLEDRTAPRVEVFHYCDIAAGREVLRLAPEAVAFLPCRIAVMEDADKNIWVITLDWDLAWLDTIRGSMGIHPELARHAIDIRDKMDEIMRAAANGDL
ncbi:MAG: DUF302 domain-containing protein [Thiobacillaceae bacterium]|nr:DUF302 domain-containing protein [Thiobacillaceae bacterium]MCX7673850.1 DUF302 domain-containing protein [Thiobacillaceae bacterium]MDW8323648.1 DUF302 domain-containing protein [Burkholderiales bacterium]